MKGEEKQKAVQVAEANWRSCAKQGQALGSLAPRGKDAQSSHFANLGLGEAGQSSALWKHLQKAQLCSLRGRRSRAMLNVLRSENNLEKPVLSLCHVGSRNGSQVTTPDRK